MCSPIKSGDGFLRMNQHPLNIGKDSHSPDNINAQEGINQTTLTKCKYIRKVKHVRKIKNIKS